MIALYRKPNDDLRGGDSVKILSVVYNYDLLIKKMKEERFSQESLLKKARKASQFSIN